MSFDLDKLQAVAELGEVIRLQNEAIERLQAFRKARPYMMMPNLAKMVEENLKENVMVLYKELNNLHKPQTEQTRYICKECKMAFVSALPGGICDECRSRMDGGQPRDYVPYSGGDDQEEEVGSDTSTATDAEPEAKKTDVADDNSIEDAYTSALGGDGETASGELDTHKAVPAEPSSDDTELYLADGEDLENVNGNDDGPAVNSGQDSNADEATGKEQTETMSQTVEESFANDKSNKSDEESGAENKADNKDGDNKEKS